MSDEETGDSGETGDDDALADEWAAALEQQDDGEPGTDADDLLNDIQAAQLDPLVDESLPQITDDNPNLNVILDIPVIISMEVGNTEISIRNLLQLNQGSVIELDRLAGEALDVLVNGTLIAHGEVVVVNEKFGIRLTDIVSPSERVKKLR